MVSESVEKVLQAEDKAAKQQKQAELEAKKIVTDAVAQAEEIIKKSKTAADAEYAKMTKQAGEAAEEILKDERIQTEKYTAELRENTKPKMQAAIDAVLKIITQ